MWVIGLGALADWRGRTVVREGDRGLRQGREDIQEVTLFCRRVLDCGPGRRNQRCHITDDIRIKRRSQSRERRAFEEGVGREVWRSVATRTGLPTGKGVGRVTRERLVRRRDDEEALSRQQVWAAEVLVGLAVQHALQPLR